MPNPTTQTKPTPESLADAPRIIAFEQANDEGKIAPVEAPEPEPAAASVAPAGRDPKPKASALTGQFSISLPRKDLIAALAAVRPAAGGGSTSLPILNNVFISAASGQLTLTATNLDIHLRIACEASVNKPGEVTCRAALLADILRLSDSEEVCLTQKGHLVLVECGQSRHELATLPASDFPPFPEILVPTPAESEAFIAPNRQPQQFTLEDAVFRTMLAETLFACGTDDKRPVLSGVLVQIVDGTLNVAGCNGFMLGVSSAPLESPNFTCILPAYCVRELLRLLSADAEKPHRLTVTAGGGQIQFQFGEITLFSRLIEGEYPKYHKIIPPEKVTANLSRLNLVRSVSRITLVADQVRLDFTANRLTLISVGKHRNEYVGTASDALLIPSNHASAGTFSCHFLLEVLTAIPDEALEVHLAAKEGGPSLFKPTGREWRGVLCGLTPALNAIKPIAPSGKATQPAAKPANRK